MGNELLEKEDLSKKILSKGFWVYFFVILSAPVGYIGRLLLSRSVSVEEVGLFYAALGLITILSTYNDLGFTEALQYFIPKYRIAGEKQKVKFNILLSFFMQMFSGVLIFCALYFGADRIAEVHFSQMEAVGIIKTLAFYFLGYNIVQLCTSIFISFQDTFSQGLMDFIRQFWIFFFSLFFRRQWDLTTEHFSLSRILGIAIAIIVGLTILTKKYYQYFKKILLPATKEERKLSAKKHFSYAIIVFITTNITVLLSQIDLQIVINIMGDKNAGYFTNFQSLLTIFSMIANSIIALLFPITTELIERKDQEGFKKMKNVMFSLLGGLSIVISGFFLFFGEELAMLCFGPSYKISGEMLQILSPFFLFNCRYSIAFNILAGLGKVSKRFRIIMTALCINLLLNYLFIIHGGKWIEYSSAIMGITRMIMGILGILTVRRQQHFTMQRSIFIKNIIGILCCYLPFQWIKTVFPFNENRKILLTGGMLYLIIFILINIPELNFIRKRAKKFFKRW